MCCEQTIFARHGSASAFGIANKQVAMQERIVKNSWIVRHMGTVLCAFYATCPPSLQKSRVIALSCEYKMQRKLYMRRFGRVKWDTQGALIKRRSSKACKPLQSLGSW